MKKVGILSYWGFARGTSYLCLQLVETLKDKFDIHILKRGANPILPEFQQYEDNIKLTEYPTYNVPKRIFKQWIEDNKLEHIIFIDEHWFEMQIDFLVDVCNDLNIKSSHIIMWEKFNPEHKDYYNSFTNLICPTECSYKKVLKSGFDNAKYVKWGINLNTFKYNELKDTKKITFFHPSGYGGIHERKSTKEVVDSFLHFKNKKHIELIITQQSMNPGTYGVKDKEGKQVSNIKIIGGTISQKDMINLYQNTHVVLLPSKHEGLGIPFLEAMSCGKPVITVDTAPMNEFIRNNINGLLVSAKEIRTFSDIFVSQHIPDIKDLTNKINIISQPLLLKTLSRNAIYISQSEYNWKENCKKLIEILQK